MAVHAIAYIAAMAVFITIAAIASTWLINSYSWAYVPKQFAVSPNIVYYYSHVDTDQDLASLGYPYGIKILIYNPENAPAVVDIVLEDQNLNPLTRCIAYIRNPDGSPAIFNMSLIGISIGGKAVREITCLMKNQNELAVKTITPYTQLFR